MQVLLNDQVSDELDKSRFRSNGVWDEADNGIFGQPSFEQLKPDKSDLV